MPFLEFVLRILCTIFFLSLWQERLHIICLLFFWFLFFHFCFACFFLFTFFPECARGTGHTKRLISFVTRLEYCCHGRFISPPSKVQTPKHRESKSHPCQPCTINLAFFFPSLSLMSHVKESRFFLSRYALDPKSSCYCFILFDWSFTYYFD